MTQFAPGCENGHDDSTDTLDDRDLRALTERMGVLPDDGDGLHTVAGENGGTYTVDVREGRCTCPDATYREGEGACKHALRVAFETGERPLPAWLDVGEVGDDFRQFISPGEADE